MGHKHISKKLRKSSKRKSNGTADVPYVVLKFLTAAGFYSMFCLRGENSKRWVTYPGGLKKWFKPPQTCDPSVLVVQFGRRHSNFVFLIVLKRFIVYGEIVKIHWEFMLKIVCPEI